MSCSEDRVSICEMFVVKPEDLVVITGSASPLYDFWKMVHEGKLPKACVVAFLRPLWNDNWDDLSDYPGVQIGRSYIMKYDPITRVRVCPSQRGLFLRR